MTGAGAARIAIGGGGEREEESRSIDSAGLWLFIASESMLFAAFISARFYLAGTARPDTLNLALGVGLTLDLVASSAAGYWATRSIRRGDQRGVLLGLAGAIALGVVFVVGVAAEWAGAEFRPFEPYGSAFFATTGLHVFHVLGGLAVLALVYRLARRGRYSAEHHWPVTAAVRYWAFVDAMWVLVIFPTLYLV